MSEVSKVTPEDREALRGAVRVLAADWLPALFEHSATCVTHRYIIAVLRLAEVTPLELVDWATWGDGSYEL